MKKILLLSFLATILITFEVSAQQYWGAGGGLWTSAGWSNSSSGPFTQAYVSGSAVNFNLAGTIGGTSGINFSSITANEDMTLSSATSNTMSTSGTVATILVASGKTLDLSTQPMSTATGTGLIKNGLGNLAIAGGAYTGGFTLNDGMVVLRGVNGMGAGGVLNIAGGRIAGSANRDLSGKYTSIVVTNGFGLGSTTSPASGTANLTFDASINLGNSFRVIDLRGTGTNTFSGIISGTSTAGIGLAYGSTGTLILSGANTYPGPTYISGGTLTLGASGVIPDASDLTLNGGTLKTGITTGFSETLATLNLLDNSNITLGSGIHTMTFANSSTAGWDNTKTLTITGWAGGYNSTSGTAGKIFFGSNATGLTAQQLSQIKFFNGSINYDATILSTGEIVPSTITVLPIQLTAFAGKAIDKSILLNWNTASETNNNYYDVLRSADGKSFTSIGTVKGAGTSTISKDYLFSDENPYAGINYYQLVQHDFDGKTASSAIIPVDSKIEAATLSVYANGSSVKISLSSPNKTKGLLQVFDIAGRKLSENSVEVNKGYNSFDLPLSLSNGIHFARYISGTETINQKFIK